MRVQSLFEGVWEINSDFPGPTLAVIGGVHGNEQTGVVVVEHLLDICNKNLLQIEKGRLLLIIGNPLSVKMGVRHTPDGQDMNRMFSDSILAGDPHCYEAGRAHILARILKGVDVAIDIHATNKPSEPFVVCQRLPTEPDLRILRWFEVESVVTDPMFVFAGEPVTLDEFVIRSGGIGLCYETGQAGDLSRKDRVADELMSVLWEVGMISHQPRQTLVHKKVYCLMRSFCLGEEGFRWNGDMGSSNFQLVKEGDVIGWHGDTPEVSEVRGVIIFPKVKALWELTKPLGYLARLM